MLNNSLKITSVSGFGFVIKNSLVFLVFDFLENSNEYFYLVMLIYIYLQSYVLHSKFTLKRRIGIESFILFFKLNLIIYLADYFIFTLINIYFPYVVISTIIISIFTQITRIILFSKEMS